MDPATLLPALPFTVGADRVGARRRRRTAWPVLLVVAVVLGVAVGLGFTAVATGPAGLALVCWGVAVAAFVAGVPLLRQVRRPPEDDWLFRLEPDGLRLPPGARAPSGHPGYLIPWPLLAGVTPRRLAGEPVAVLTVAPPGEQVLLGQGATPAQAAEAVRRGFRLRLSDGTVEPAECVRLIVATRAARLGAA